MTTTRGTFTVSQEWLTNPPSRCDLDVSQLCDLMRLALDGQPIPVYSDPQDLLADIHLVAMNEINRQRGRAEYEAAAGRAARLAAGAVWRVVWAAGKRLTLRTADVRAALEDSSGLPVPETAP